MRTVERERWAAEIRSGRLNAKLTQAQLAQLLVDRAAAAGSQIAVRQADVSDWENGVRLPNDHLKGDLIRVLSIEPSKVAPEWLKPLLRRQQVA